jgi:hypothetical protein
VAVAAAVDVEEVCTPFKSSIPSLPHATPTNTDLELSDAMRCDALCVRACVASPDQVRKELSELEQGIIGMGDHLSAAAKPDADDQILSAQEEFVNTARSKLNAALLSEQQMLQKTRELSAYFACKSEREHSRVLRTLQDFRPMVETCLKKAATAASAPVDQGAAEGQTAAGQKVRPRGARVRTKGDISSRKALGARNVNGNDQAQPAQQMMMEGLGAAVAARAASRRAALAALP